MNRSRAGWIVVGTLVAIGCAGPIYELTPVPRAGDGTPPVKAPRRRRRLVLTVPADGLAPLEVAVADPAPGGPRWPAGRVLGGYFCSGLSFAGSPRLSALEPIGFAARVSRERWVLGLGASYTFL